MSTIELIPYKDNPRQISDKELKMLGKSMREYGDLSGVVRNIRDNKLISGHQRVKSILERYGSYEVKITGKNVAGENTGIVKAGNEEINYREVDWPEEMSVPARLAANKQGGDWLQDKLDLDIDLDLTGFDVNDIDIDTQSTEYDLLKNRFIVPPFSVLDARQGYWQERKRAWLVLGIQGELGRNEGVVGSMKSINIEKYGRKEQKLTSVFDPVLCELMYKWFCPNNAKILDPFAGGSMRGIVAEYLKYNYTGIELRQEQVEANETQAKRIKVNPKWITGDSINITSLINGKYDFIFSCPPYYDLEVYSDLEGELSVIPTYNEFLICYRGIVNKSIELLNNNRFACFVVGDVRDKKGFYRNFVSDTIQAFQDGGMKLYNDAILITMVGSLPIRVGKQFSSYRKLGKTHQNVLIFYKGDIKNIREFGEINVDDLVKKEYISDMELEPKLIK